MPISLSGSHAFSPDTAGYYALCQVAEPLGTDSNSTVEEPGQSAHVLFSQGQNPPPGPHIFYPHLSRSKWSAEEGLL